MRIFKLGAVVCLVAAGCGRGTPAPPRLDGVGSTFVSPLMVQWTAAYQKTENACPINYEGTGSGYGIKQIIANKVDFACTDAPLTDEELAQARQGGGDVVHVPLVLGAVVPVYNLPGLSEPLRFSGPLLADIFLGKIRKWNDAAIKELNPSIADHLPDEDIVVIHRSDGSGTTYIWADYLSKVSPEWKQKVGAATVIPWPVGEAEIGNEGVSTRVRKTARSIGYVELSFSYRYELAFGLVQNREKEFVKARPESIRMAAENGLGNIPDDLRFSLTDPPGKGSYPICGTTWAVVRVDPHAGKGRLLQDFLFWATSDGQQYADMLLYVPLPEALLDRARNKIILIHVS